MKSVKILALITLLPLFLFSQALKNEQDILDLMRNSLLNQQKSQELQATDLVEIEIKDQHVSSLSGVHHSYIYQYYQGIEIYQAISSIHLMPNGKIIQLNNQFATQLQSKIKTVVPSITAIEAIQQAAKALNHSEIGELYTLKTSNQANQQQTISKYMLSSEEIPAKLVFFQKVEGEIELAWDLSIKPINSNDWWNMKIDASTGELLEKQNMILHCKHGNTDHVCSAHPTTNKIAFEHCEDHPTSFAGSYRVFDLPLSDPTDGVRTLVSNPDDSLASPFGWHDTDGIAGAEFTTTQGNNIHAYDDGDNAGYSPDGGTALTFDYPLDITLDPNLYEDAAMTNAFYWGNKTHDILYQYGFDEASGNFQVNNYGRGGVDGDIVNIRVQTSNNCNGTFGSSPDGAPGTMTLFLCQGIRDGAYNNTTITHEYAHGWSRRLAGGPSTTSCISNQEQMGEGWSDYLALMLTIEATDTRTDSRPYGSWFYDNPNGIRPFTYNTDMAINNATYNDIANVSVPHGVGNVWATMLWDMTWDLIDQHGFDTDIYNGTGGNNISLALVSEGLKLQSCNPGFVDGRNAILAADQALYAGANQCLIWGAFAKRGLGVNASQGSSASVSDGIEAYNLPTSCGGTGCILAIDGPNSKFISPLGATDSTFSLVADSLWTATSLVPWITLDSTSGVGNPIISFDALPNPGFTLRTGIIELSCDSSYIVNYTITQPGLPCVQNYTSIPYTTGFELGQLDTFWCSTSSDIGGRILVSSQNTPHNGGYHMTMDTDNIGTYSQNEATLGLKLAGETAVNLSFYYKEFGDENDPEDGLFLSDDAGANYVKVFDFTDDPTNYTLVLMNLSQLALANGLSLTDSFIVKFQQYDNYSVPTDGFAFDDINVTTPNCTVGTPCNDNDPCTTNDVLNNICFCEGTFEDSDGDGVCDFNDICPGGNDNQDLDGDGIPDFCDSQTACNSCTQLINSFPHIEDFEPDVKEICQFSGDDFNWTIRSGTTPSTNTGPTAAYEGNNYFYIESSNPNYPYKTASFQSGCYDLTSAGVATLDFWYHMYGVDMGTVNLEVSSDTGATWTSVWSKTGDQGDLWQFELIDVSNLAGGIMSYRFVATVGSYYTSDFALDKIVVRAGPANCTPGASCDDNNNCTTGDVFTTNCICQGTFQDSDNDGVCDAEDACPGFPDDEDFDGDNIPDGCDNVSCDNCASLITTYPHTEDFEPDVKLICQYPGDDFDWEINTGPTASGSTGPTAAYEGANYFYTESSLPNFPSKRSAFESGCYDLSQAGTASIDFWYHMWGTTMGLMTIEVTVDTGNIWTQVWSQSGDQGNAWNQATVDLTNYVGGTLSYRISGSTYGSYTSDMALDKITVDITACLGGTCDDNDSCTVNDIFDAFCNCSGTFQDSDNDTVCDAQDVCPGYDDTVDTDSDGVPDGCDSCLGYDDTVDSDIDGVPDGCDSCPGYDDTVDSDIDSVPDGCDICPGYDDTVDSDGDGIPDGCDTTPVENFQTDEELTMLATPNPFSNQLLFSLELAGYSNKGTISIVDVVGKSILKLPIEWNNAYQHQLEIDYLSSGVYYIQYEDDHFNIIQKILKIE